MGVFISHNSQIKKIFFTLYLEKCLICASTAGNVHVNYCTIFEQYCTVYTNMYF